jgi:hypothetical protein
MVTLRTALSAPPDPAIEEAASADLSLPDSGNVVRHPDGYYWLADEGRQEFGPFSTVDEALAEMHAASDDGLEPGETLQEAERELGMSEWVDPDTGELAEDTHGRFEDH